MEVDADGIGQGGRMTRILQIKEPRIMLSPFKAKEPKERYTA
jgi:hypothetical protein